MLHVDIISAYAICGASSLVAVGMLLMAEIDDAEMARAIRFLVAGFAVVGIGLFQVGFAVDDGSQRNLPMLGATLAALLGPSLFGWAFAHLRGWRPPRWLAWVVGLLLVVDVVAWTGTPARFELIFNASGFAVSLGVLSTQRRFSDGQHRRAERALAASLIGYALSWAVRLGYTLTGDGSYSFYIGHLPARMLPWLGVFYGTIPIIIAALTLNLVNGRLWMRLRVMVLTDELTGTRTRRGFRELAPELLARQHALGRRVATLMVDIDHFKVVNDSHGHLGGDAVLRRAAELLFAHVRNDSVVTRFGGEEFAVLLPVHSLSEAKVVAERLRKAFEDDRCAFEGREISVTISSGLTLVTPGEPVEQALQRADAALYRAKRGGRNRVEVGEPREVATAC